MISTVASCRASVIPLLILLNSTTAFVIQVLIVLLMFFFFFQAEDGIRDSSVTWSSDVCSSDLLRASALGRARADHAFALHPRVRGSPAAVRLAREHADRGRQAAADRVRAAEPELHGHEQAQAAATRSAGSCDRPETSPDPADHGPAPP